MALVQYPDSDSDQEHDSRGITPQLIAGAPKTAVKRKHSESAQNDLPPLPAAFHDLYSTNARASTSDDPSLHGGRKRAIPHVEGNWPSHIYLEWIPSQTESENLHNLIQYVRDTIELQNKNHAKRYAVPKIVPSLESDLGAPLPLHVSLSRTLQIKTEDRDAFLESLRSCLRKAAVHSFHFKFRNLKWVPNFERNRWFLVLGIEKPAHNELNRLLGACNEATGRYGHPGLYVGGPGDGPMENKFIHDGPKRRKSEQEEGENIDHSEHFHVSIAWNLEEPHPELIPLISSIDVSKHVQSPQAAFEVAKARVGNMVHNIDLKVDKRRHAIRKGILGLE